MSKLNFNGRAGGQLPDAAERLLEHHDLAPGTRIVERGNRDDRNAHARWASKAATKCRSRRRPTITPETAQSDAARRRDDRRQVPQNVGAERNQHLRHPGCARDAPEGLTLNPAAAHGLQACTAAQIGIGTTNPVACPAASKVGTVTIETDLPPGSLTGNVYLGSPSGGADHGPPYTIYLDAESALRRVGQARRGRSPRTRAPAGWKPRSPNNPQLPFSELRLKLNGGAARAARQPARRAGPTTVESPSRPTPAARRPSSSTPFPTTGCPSPLPFSLDQSTQKLERRRRRLHRLHVQPGARGRPAVPVAAHRPRCPPAWSARSRRSRCAANRRRRRGRARRRARSARRPRTSAPAPNRTHSPARST